MATTTIPAPRRLNARSFWEVLPDLFEKNGLSRHANVDGHMFETYGEELDYVLSIKDSAPNRVVTIVEGGRGHWYVAHGYHYVNRVGYLIANAPLPEFPDFRY